MTARAPRREILLAAAADLFAARGFHAVGIDDLGAAAGISGPGVYRHFPSKLAILEALCEQAMHRMLEGARGIPARYADDPRAAMEALVDLHVDVAVRHRALMGVWLREQRALSEASRRALRRRQRAYELPWRQVLGALRSDLGEAEVAVAVTATLGMLNVTSLVDTDLAPDGLAALLRGMALAALLAPGRVPTG